MSVCVDIRQNIEVFCTPNIRLANEKYMYTQVPKHVHSVDTVIRKALISEQDAFIKY